VQSKPDCQREHKLNLITARAAASMLLLDFHRRAVQERKIHTATVALRIRMKFLKDLREHRGWKE
jgi:hypothetical protein